MMSTSSHPLIPPPVVVGVYHRPLMPYMLWCAPHHTSYCMPTCCSGLPPLHGTWGVGCTCSHRRCSPEMCWSSDHPWHPAERGDTYPNASIVRGCATPLHALHAHESREYMGPAYLWYKGYSPWCEEHTTLHHLIPSHITSSRPRPTPHDLSPGGPDPRSSPRSRDPGILRPLGAI